MDIFNYFAIAGKFILIFTLTNNMTINIFIPMKSGLPPSQSDFAKIHLVGSGCGTLADPTLYKLCFIFVFTVTRDDVWKMLMDMFVQSTPN